MTLQTLQPEHQDIVSKYSANAPLVVLAPAYEDEQALGKLLLDLKSVFDDKVFVIIVDDGSVKEPLGAAHLNAANISGSIVKLKRNVGHQRAIAVGLAYIAEHFPESEIVIMDSDGEDRPDTIPELLACLRNETVDIAVATRTRRDETVKFKIGYQIYKRIFGYLTGRHIDFGNFSAMNAAAVSRLSVMFETSLHIAASALVSRLRLKRVPIARGSRYAGKSKMNTVGLILHGFRAVMVFAESVMVRMSLLAAFLALACGLVIAAAITLKILGYATPGWFSITIGIGLLALLQIGVLTLTSLLMTGVVKLYPQPLPDNLSLIKHVETARQEPAAAGIPTTSTDTPASIAGAR